MTGVQTCALPISLKLTIDNLDKKMLALKEQCKPTDELKENGATRRNARNACRDVIELYGDDPSELIKLHVAEAKRLMEDVKKLDG